MRAEEIETIGPRARIQVAVGAIHAVAKVVAYHSFRPQVAGCVYKQIAAVANHVTEFIMRDRGSVGWCV